MAGHGVDVLGLDLPAVQVASAAGDLDRLGGVRESQPARNLDGFEAADLVTTVSLLPGGVAEGDLVPGQRLEEVVQLGMVVLHGRDVGGFLLLDEELRVRVLGVQGVERDGAAGKVERCEKRFELADLALLPGDLPLVQRRAFAVGE
ncbi:hypothetical protein I3F59_000055 [Streptomyces sp. MUM 178J]|nr:hypothetical protein [Streptomyces sp. MUM 178J]WRQ77906.1 hypothetical protein I3F59_000055 [Streptomyces sp. MUM 178J]